MGFKSFVVVSCVFLGAAVVGLLLCVDFPVHAATWGNVAEWIGGVGTTAAAVVAVGYYVYDSEQKRRAQAALVTAYHANTSGSDFAITVENGSELPVNGFLVYFKERRLLPTLLGRGWVSFDSGNGDLTHETVDYSQHPKNRVVGFDGRSGMLCLGDTNNISLRPGDTREVPASREQVDGKRHVFRLSTVYWVWFTDANGLWWQREATMNATMPGRLKKLNISPASFDNNTFTHVGPVKRAWVYCKRSWKATVWLVRNRGSSTKSDPGGH